MASDKKITMHIKNQEYTAYMVIRQIIETQPKLADGKLINKDI